MWEEFGHVERDPAVVAGYRPNDGDIGMRRFLDIVRDAMVRQISAFVLERPRPRVPSEDAHPIDHGPILQPGSSRLLAPATRHLRRLQTEPAQPLATPYLDSSLLLDTGTQPENMAARVQQGEALAPGNWSLAESGYLPYEPAAHWWSGQNTIAGDEFFTPAAAPNWDVELAVPFLSTQSVVANAPDADEYLELENAGENDFMPDGLN